MDEELHDLWLRPRQWLDVTKGDQVWISGRVTKITADPEGTGRRNVGAFTTEDQTFTKVLSTWVPVVVTAPSQSFAGQSFAPGAFAELVRTTQQGMAAQPPGEISYGGELPTGVVVPWGDAASPAELSPGVAALARLVTAIRGAIARVREW